MADSPSVLPSMSRVVVLPNTIDNLTHFTEFHHSYGYCYAHSHKSPEFPWAPNIVLVM